MNLNLDFVAPSLETKAHKEFIPTIGWNLPILAWKFLSPLSGWLESRFWTAGMCGDQLLSSCLSNVWRDAVDIFWWFRGVFVCLSVCFFVCLFACLLGCLFACLLACLFVCLFVCLFAELTHNSITTWTWPRNHQLNSIFAVFAVWWTEPGEARWSLHHADGCRYEFSKSYSSTGFVWSQKWSLLTSSTCSILASSFLWMGLGPLRRCFKMFLWIYRYIDNDIIDRY